jgi:hypothetical protein
MQGMSRRFPGPFEGVLMALGAGAVGYALYDATNAQWSSLGGALVFAALMLAAGAWSHRLGRRRER